MYNLTLTNRNFNGNVFHSAYNFRVSGRDFWSKPDSAANSKKQKFSNKQQSYINFGVLTLACAALFFSREGQKSVKNLLEITKDFLNKRQDKYFFDDCTKKVSFYDFTLRKINSFIRKTESVNNVNSIKDMLFMKLMYKTTPTKFIHKGVSNFFESLSRNTVLKSYKNTQKHFSIMFDNFDRLDEYILKQFGDETVEYNGKNIAKKELLEIARDKLSLVRMVVDVFIKKETQDIRYDYIKKVTSRLYSQIWDKSFKDFWTKDNKFKRKEMWQTFIAAEQIKNNKTDLTDNVAFARNLLSYTDAEKKAYIQTFINNLSGIIPVNDTKGIEILERLKWYVKDRSLIAKNKDSFLKDLENLEKHDISIENDVYNRKNKILEDKDKNIHHIKNIIIEDAPGDIEKVIDLYRKIAPIELAKSGTLKSVEKAVESFDKSIKLENIELFNKLRDLEIGSAPTDILTILFSSALIVYALEKAKNSEERTSILLKSGIPIAGAIYVTLISAAKLVSGSKSLLLGFVSGVIMNRVGQIVDNYRKNSRLNA